VEGKSQGEWGEGKKGTPVQREVTTEGVDLAIKQQITKIEEEKSPEEGRISPVLKFE